MEKYLELPVYKSAYDLLLLVFQLTHNLAREHKFTIGKKFKNEITNLLTNIYRANRVGDKREFITQARENLEIVRLYILILKDCRQISSRKHVFISQPIESVSKQLSGWHKSIEKADT